MPGAKTPGILCLYVRCPCEKGAVSETDRGVDLPQKGNPLSVRRMDIYFFNTFLHQVRWLHLGHFK